jgi:GT2 family glycosyltransferase
MKGKPLVSIVTVNFNQVQHTMDLLKSLRKVTYPNFEVIVVDNCSHENPEPEISRSYPEVKIVVSDENLGFAGGNNLGVLKSSGKYVMFLNNDTEVDPSFLEPLVELFEQNPTAGAASSKILYFNSDNIIQYAGSTALNPLTGRNKRIGYQERDNGQHNTLRETDLAHGCAMMVPRKVIDEVGMMPELFFLYYEEIDWCETIKRGGYKIYFVPQSKVYHKESMSVGKKSTLKTYYMTRNRLLFMRRNSSGFRKTTAMLYFMFLALPKNLFVHLLHKETEHIKALWRGCVWNITHLSNGNKHNLLA